MTALLVDIGNTRVKWALLRGARLTRMRARAHARRAGVMRAIVNSAPRDVVRVIAVCVAGATMERELAAAARGRFGVRVEFVRSTRQAAGVRNGYRDTWRLGADRWVGVIAAHALSRGRPALIANIGTALTIDAVTGSGRHLGGAIAPGPVTMITSLLAGTHGIRRRAGGAGGKTPGSRALYARDTARALESGANHAAAALIDRAAQAGRNALGAPPMLILTGGAATRLRPYIKNPVRVVPDLVLRGLAVLARG